VLWQNKIGDERRDGHWFPFWLDCQGVRKYVTRVVSYLLKVVLGLRAVVRVVVIGRVLFLGKVYWYCSLG